MIKLEKGYFSRFSSVIALIVLGLIAGTVLRLLLLFVSSEQVLTTPGELLKVFFTGSFFDIIVLPQALLPLIIYLAAVPQRFFAGKFNQGVVLFSVWFITSLILLDACIEYYFWDEFQSRFNFIAIDYLVYTNEVWGSIRASYPVVPLLLGISLLAAAVTVYIQKKWLCWHTSLSLKKRGIVFGAGLLFPLLIFGSVHGNIKNVSDNVYNNALAENGLYELFSAFRNNELDYNRFYKTKAAETMETTLRQLLKEANSDYQNSQPWNLTRIVKGGEEKHPHIVFITVESLSANFMTDFGNRRGLTPHLDRLAAESLFFTQVYATGTRTVRGLEAVTLAIPPTPGQSILRRPDNASLFSLGSVLGGKKYVNWFIYGGYGYFDNMNDFYTKNGYQILDRTDIPKEKIVAETVWGVADEVIFNEAIAVLDKAHAKGEKTFELIMTTSNHRPYIYPDGRIDIRSPGGREGAVKYTDWAIGNFLAEAKKHPWFKDTVFIITADHQAESSGKTELPIKKYHIPLLIYAPEWIKPGRVDRLMSQIDIAPTLLGLLNFSYDSRFMGYDLLKLPEGQERIFISTYQNLGYIKGNKLVVLKPKKKISLYQIDYNTGKYTLLPEDEKLIDEAIAWYQGASLLYKSGQYQALNVK